MPLTVNVGLSRKGSRNYQSRGVSLNITAELDQTLLARPEELQQRIDALFAQVEQSIGRQLGFRDNPPLNPPLDNHPAGNSAPRNGRSAPGMTANQRNAINTIANRLELDAAEVCRLEFDSI